jgi:hypothetical protein
MVISVPTEEMCSQFNDLRSDMVLLYELKNALNNCEHELQTLKATYEAMCPGQLLFGFVCYSREPLLKGKAQYSWPPH